MDPKLLKKLEEAHTILKICTISIDTLLFGFLLARIVPKFESIFQKFSKTAKTWMTSGDLNIDLNEKMAGRL